MPVATKVAAPVRPTVRQWTEGPVDTAPGRAWARIRNGITVGLFVMATAVGTVVGLGGADVSAVAPVTATAAGAVVGSASDGGSSSTSSSVTAATPNGTDDTDGTGTGTGTDGEGADGQHGGQGGGQGGDRQGDGDGGRR